MFLAWIIWYFKWVSITMILYSYPFYWPHPNLVGTWRNFQGLHAKIWCMSHKPNFMMKYICVWNIHCMKSSVWLLCDTGNTSNTCISSCSTWDLLCKYWCYKKTCWLFFIIAFNYQCDHIKGLGKFAYNFHRELFSFNSSTQNYLQLILKCFYERTVKY